MKEEVLFLSLVTYTTILTLMTIFLLLGCKPNQDYGKMVKDYIRELKLDKNIFGIIYSIDLIRISSKGLLNPLVNVWKALPSILIATGVLLINFVFGTDS